MNPLIEEKDNRLIVSFKGSKLAKIGEMVKVATKEQCPVSHPTMDYPGPDILVWTQVITSLTLFL